MRGLCLGCHRAAYRSIQNGEHTEQELIDAKLILPSKVARVSPWTLKAEEVLGG